MTLSLRKCLVILLTASFIMIWAPFCSVAMAEAKDDREQAANLALLFSKLRDQLADRRLMILKLNLDPSTSMGDSEVDNSFKNIEESIATLDNMLTDASVTEKKALKRLAETIGELHQAEKNHMQSWMELRNGAARSLLTLIALTEISLQVTDRTDAVALGGQIAVWEAREDLGAKTLPESHEPFFQTLPPIESGEKTISDEKEAPVLTTTPGDGPFGIQYRDVQPSSDPAQLRLAYEAARAWHSLNHQVYWVPWQSQLAMFDSFSAPNGMIPPIEKVEEAVALFKRLPHLTPQAIRAFDRLPQELAGMELGVEQFAEILEKRKETMVEYEKLSESALLRAGEMRDFYIKRLASK